MQNSTQNQTKGQRNSYYNLLNAFLFSVLGLSSYFFLLFYTDILNKAGTQQVFSLPLCIAVLISFNIMCFSFLKLNSSVNAHYPYAYDGVFRVFLFFVFIAAILIGYNFLLYGITAYVAEVNNPFHLERFTWTKLSVICLVELVIMCLMMLNHSARFTIKLYRETEELKQYQSIAEFKALQYQLNPHFLFNSLNTLLSEIEYDPANAKLFTTRLAEVYRYILQTQEKRTVPVSEELEFLKAYIYLHQVRLGAGLNFQCDFPESGTLDFLQEKRIPPLALQLLVENALKHNTVNRKRPLLIRVVFAPDLSSLTVTNELRPKKNVKSFGGGLNNLSERYRLLADKKIRIEKTEKTFEVQIPLLDGYTE